MSNIHTLQDMFRITAKIVADEFSLSEVRMVLHKEVDDVFSDWDKPTAYVIHYNSVTPVSEYLLNKPVNTGTKFYCIEPNGDTQKFNEGTQNTWNGGVKILKVEDDSQFKIRKRLFEMLEAAIGEALEVRFFYRNDTLFICYVKPICMTDKAAGTFISAKESVLHNTPIEYFFKSWSNIGHLIRPEAYEVADDFASQAIDHTLCNSKKFLATYNGNDSQMRASFEPPKYTCIYIKDEEQILTPKKFSSTYDYEGNFIFVLEHTQIYADPMISYEKYMHKLNKIIKAYENRSCTSFWVTFSDATVSEEVQSLANLLPKDFKGKVGLRIHNIQQLVALKWLDSHVDYFILDLNCLAQDGRWRVKLGPEKLDTSLIANYILDRQIQSPIGCLVLPLCGGMRGTFKRYYGLCSLFDFLLLQDDKREYNLACVALASSATHFRNLNVFEKCIYS